jgi:hypothetical protein
MIGLEAKFFLQVKHQPVLPKSASWEPEAAPARLRSGRALSFRASKQDQCGTLLYFDRARVQCPGAGEHRMDTDARLQINGIGNDCGRPFMRALVCFVP